MAAYVYSAAAGTPPREFPGDGERPSFTLEPGQTVDLDGVNPWPDLLTAKPLPASVPAPTEE